ncbi:MAG: guanylate kinase [Oligoflexia bacterium]|nr:guanylate kinase [Oligoflexia bacterium]
MSRIPREGILFCLCGPAGVGKTILGKRVLETYAGTLVRSVSVTTRAPRAGEVDGESYHFIRRDEFEKRASEGAFFEWEEVHGNLYGTLKSSLSDVISSGRDLLLIIEIRGSLAVKRAFPKNAVVIFVVPPSFKELKQRLLGRGADSKQELETRLNTAKGEFEKLLAVEDQSESVDYLVVNEDLENAFSQLRTLIEAERSRFERMNRAAVKRLAE